ncbi:hypothetical protein G7Y79_00038g074670 [Physcia stellaris]|nr:hypothetical protein G7Y79_00038g074670 [Physcia stellaris]
MSSNGQKSSPSSGDQPTNPRRGGLQGAQNVDSRSTTSAASPLSQADHPLMSSQGQISTPSDENTGLGLSQSSSALPAVGADVPTGAQAVPSSGRPRPRNRGEMKQRLAEVKQRLDAEKEAARQAEAETANAAKRGRAISDVGDDTPAAKDRSRQVGESMEVDPPLRKILKAFPFRAIEMVGPKRCFFRINDRPLLGSVENTKGWKVFMRLDGGRYGDPSITLTLKANKEDGEVNAEVGKDSDVEIISLLFWPSVQSKVDPSRYTMNDYETFDLTGPKIDGIWLPEVLNTIKSEAAQKGAMAFRFRARECEIDHVPDAHVWLKHDRRLPNTKRHALKHALNKVAGSDEEFSVTIWTTLIVPTPDCDLWFQYYDGDKPVLDLIDSETIDKVGNGMYRIYDTKGVGKEKVEDTAGKVLQFFNHDEMRHWVTDDEFKICHSLTTVREFHTVQAQQMHAQRLNQFAETYFAYIRMSIKDKADAPPQEGLKVELEWDNRGAASAKDNNAWYGEVVRPDPEFLKLTRTHFCVMLKKPFDAVAKRPHQVFKAYDNPELYRCFLTVKVNDKMAKQGLKAIEAFMESDRPLVRFLKQALMSKMPLPAAEASEYINLAQGPPGTDEMEKKDNERLYEEYVKDCMRKNDNERQTYVLRMAAWLHWGLCMTQGPPGTGKSMTIVMLLWGLLLVGHKVVVFAGNNDVLDNLLNIAAYNRPASCKGMKIVRAETSKVLFRSTVKRGSGWQLQYEAMDPKDIAQLPVDEDAEKQMDPTVAAAMEEAETTNEWEIFFEKEKLYEQTWEMAQKVDQRKRSGATVVAEAEMGYRIFELVKEDERAAQASYQAEVAAATELYKSDPAGLASFMQQVESAEARNPSALYMRHREYYAHNLGRVSKKQRKAFEDLTAQMMERVYDDSWLVFTTPQNAVTVAKAGWKPSVAVNEEAGTIIIADLLVVLMAFPSLIALFGFGDPRQLPPTLLAAMFNEMLNSAGISMLANWVDKKNSFNFLNVQYRMNPEIADFPNRQFYDGTMMNHPCTLVDNAIRRAARAISLDFGIKGPNGKGSCVRVVDVPLSCSRIEAGGTSLLNYAHVEAIRDELRLALEKGVDPKDIAVLVWYAGQKGLVGYEIKFVELANGKKIHKPCREVSTVDAFKGKESPYVISDLVVGDEKTGHKDVEAVIDEEMQSQTFDQPGRMKFGMATAHVKSPQRLNAAITRGRDASVIICQAATMIRCSRVVGGKEKVAVAAFIRDAVQRGILHERAEFPDTHPDAIAERQQQGEARTKYEENRRRTEKDYFLYVTKRAGRESEGPPKQ